MKHTLPLVIFLLIAGSITAQPFITTSIGIAANRPVTELSAGYQANNTMLSIGAALTSSNVSVRNNNITMAQAVPVGSFIITPSVGFAWNKAKDFSKYNDPDGLGVITEKMKTGGIFGLSAGYGTGPVQLFVFGKHFGQAYGGVGMKILFGAKP